MATFDPRKLRLERFNAEWGYHATYTFYGVKGAIAERWAHGPVFGAVAEVGTAQLNLTPATDTEGTGHLVGVIGLRTSALLGEGKGSARQAQELLPGWFGDIETALRPLRTVRISTDLIGLYPIDDEWKTTQRIKLRYYQSDALEALVGAPTFHAGPEAFRLDGVEGRTVQMGVLGPPHKGQYFAFERPDRDTRWWLGLRLAYSSTDEEGIDAPLAGLADLTSAVIGDWNRIGETIFPDLVA